MAETLRFDVVGRGDASDLERLAAAVDKFADRLKALDRVDARPEIDVDTKKAERKVGQFAENLQRRITRAIDSLPDIELDADSTDADRAIAGIRSELAALADKQIGVDIDTETARRQVVDLEQRLRSLSDVDIDVSLRADVAAAMAELRRASGEVDRLDGRTAHIKVDVDRGMGDSIVQIAALGRALGSLALPAAVVGGVAALTPTVAALGGATLSAVGAVGLLPGGLLAAAAAFTTLKVGMSGVGDALKNLDDAKKFGEALKQLAPNARQFAVAVRDIAPAWKAVRLDTQQALFAGLGAEVKRLSDAYLPTLKSGLTGVSGQFNLMAKDFVGFAAGGRTVENVGAIFSNLTSSLEAARPAAQNLAGAFLDIGVVGSELLPELAGSLTDATGRFRTFIDQARRSGELKVWIQDGIGALEKLGSIAGNVGSTLLNVFSAQKSAGAELLTTLDQLTAAMDRWTASAEGQQTLTNVFTTIRETVAAALPGLQALGQAVLDVVNRLSDAGVFQAAATAFSAIAQAVAPVVTTLGNLAAAVLPPLLAVLTNLAPVLVPVAAGLLALAAAAKVANVIQGLGDKISGFAGKLKAAEGGVGKFKTVIGGLAGALGVGGGIGLAITAAITAAGLLAGAWAESQAAAADQKAAIDALASSLNSYTGAATEATKAQVAQEVGSGKLADGTTSYAQALQRAGVSTRDFVDATTGNEQALQKVRTQLDSSVASLIKSSPAYANNAQQISAMGISLEDLTAAAQGNGPALDRINDAVNRSSAGSLEARSANELLVQSLLKSGGASAEMGQKLNDMAAQYGQAAQQARDAGAANLVFGDVLDTIKQGFAGLAGTAPITEKMAQGLRDLGASAGIAAQGAAKTAAEYGGLEAGSKAASDSMQQSRDAFINAATAAGIAAPAAEELANQVGLIPSAAAIIFSTNATGVQAEMITLNERIKALPPNTTITVTDLSDQARANLTALGFQITAIPGTKDVQITAPTDGAKASLDSFVAAGNGAVVTITGDMNTDPANGKISQTVQLGNGQTATLNYDANASAADGKIHATVTLGNGQTATLVYDANPDPATGKIQGVVTLADGSTGTVTLNPNDLVTPTIDQLKNPVQTPVNLTPNTSAVPPAKTDAATPVQTPVNLEPVPGLVPGAKADAGTPVQTPVNLEPNAGAVPGAKADAAAPVTTPVTLTVDASQVTAAKATAASPTSSMHTINVTNNVPAAVANATLATTSMHTINCDDKAVVDAKNRATQPTQSMHTINCNDSAVTAAKSRAQQSTSSTHTIHVVVVGAAPPRAAGAYTTPRAEGAYAAPMAAGGMRRMSSARAEIVPPRQPRIIGDRMEGDELFLPINRSARSQSLLKTAANRMGFDVVPHGATSPDTMLSSMRAAVSQRATASGGGELLAEVRELNGQLRALRGDVDHHGDNQTIVSELRAVRSQLANNRGNATATAQVARTVAELGAF